MTTEALLRRLGRAVRAPCAGVVVIWLGACSSAPAPRFHSLMPAPPPAAAATATSLPAGPVAWEVLAVSVPPGVDQPQWVVRSVDGSLVVLEQERWIGPLGDEIRAAVTQQFVQTLGAAAAGPARWQVRIDVLRFESAPGREARIDATWSVASSAGSPSAALRCRGEYVQAVGADGYLALAAGHQKSVARLADAIAIALRSLAAGQAAACAAA